ncbi:PEP-CTERM sorting domain-containing protein [Oryzomonas sagensis]|uniref:PEP-CTERM sorting domain-containing protein n=1 Tax=Oryzomonas sagensis TaxID=2603857 RepID=A0ABQ6TMQ7_9BACT|nr:PEP-CTERM sorting domain-containing protein [Oryzomonas sagensis]KAB0669631.1 PEP-CTERM sorting domain-containing protein [Oryzomonas sagensis]
MKLTNFKITKAILAALAIFFVSGVDANATLIYSNNFEDTVGSEWSVNTTSVTPIGNRHFLGDFSNDSTTLTLSGLSAGLATVSFDVYFIRSWDGDNQAFGPDYFNVAINNSQLLHQSFSNGDLSMQSNASQAAERYTLGYSYYNGLPGYNVTYSNMDSVYHFVLTLPSLSNLMAITFSGKGLQDNYVTGLDGSSYLDESWGLDNVIVDVAPVPEPSGLLMLFTGGAILLILCWRKPFNSARLYLNI